MRRTRGTGRNRWRHAALAAAVLAAHAVVPVGPQVHATFSPEPFVEIEPGEWQSSGFLVRGSTVDPSTGLVWMLIQQAGGGYYGLSLDPETRTWGTAAPLPTGTAAIAIAADGASVYVAHAGVLERRSASDWALLDSVTLDDRGLDDPRIVRIVAMPDDPDLVVVNAGWQHGLIAVDDGVEQPDRVPGTFLDADAVSASTIFAVSSIDMGPAVGKRVAVTPTGLAEEASMPLDAYDNTRCTAFEGMAICQDESTGVVDPSEMKFVAAWVGDTIVDPLRAKLYSETGGGMRAVRSLDGQVESMLDATNAYLGRTMAAGGVAVRLTSSSVSLIDIDDLDEQPLGALPPRFTADRPGYLAMPHGAENSLTPGQRNLVVTSNRERAFVAIPSEAATGGARIMSFHPASAIRTGSIPVPTEAVRLALSSDDRSLYATTVAGEIVQFDTATLSEVGRFTPSFPMTPIDDVVAVPGADDHVVVRLGDSIRSYVAGAPAGAARTADDVFAGPSDGQVVSTTGTQLQVWSASPAGLSNQRSTSITGEVTSTSNGSIWTTTSRLDPSTLAPTPLPIEGLVPIPGSTDLVLAGERSAEMFSTEEFAWLSRTDISWIDGDRVGGPLVHLDGERFGVARWNGIAVFDLESDMLAGGEYVALTPTRVLDTRTGLGQEGIVAPVGTNSVVELDIAGRGGVPDVGALAVVANVTVTQPSSQGYLTVWPTGEPRPVISTINFPAGRTVANLATVVLGEGGSASIFNRFGSSHIVVDVVGYYTDSNGIHGGRFRGVTPRRVLDTRQDHEWGDTTFRPASPIGQDDDITIELAQLYDGEAGFVRAAILNVTAVNPSRSTFVTVYPADVEERPLAANLNTADGRTVPNQVIVKVPPSGEITLYNRWGTVDLVVDLMGFYASDYNIDGGRMEIISPARILDTREDSPYPGDGSLFPDSTLFFEGIVDNPYSGYVMNVTVTQPTAQGFLAVHPWPGAQSTASLNFTPGLTIANHVTVAAGPGIGFYNRFGNTHVVADLFGLFFKHEATFLAATNARRGADGTTLRPHRMDEKSAAAPPPLPVFDFTPG